MVKQLNPGRGVEMSNRKIIKLHSVVLTIFAIVSSSAGVSFANVDSDIAVDSNCIPKHGHYDESHAVYSKKFAALYKLPDGNITEMPEYLQYMEFIIRSEYGKPSCYLNFSIDANPDVFYFPKEHRIRPRIDSSFGSHIYTHLGEKYLIPPRFQDKKPRPPTLGIGYYSIPNNLHTWWPSLTPTINSLFYIPNESIFMGVSVKCRANDIKTLEYLLVERANPESDNGFGKLPLHAMSMKKPEYFQFIPFPQKLKEKMTPTWKELADFRGKASICRGKKQQ